ncbi:MFS transporter [Aminithiophilus ramosus]|uniref:MFS transporter n=1 Tax=Aminithiophilus ramosus TaxID=3029084 RepID=A0A9Q7EUU8_9BACT|nr:MFS transporter [Aminithiophilus ramosus]QTX31988.1 MFS transporter [Aminithiophilus ramosus]
MTRRPLSPRGKIALLCSSHFINDIHSAFLNTFIPVIIANLGISVARAGGLQALSGAIHICCQPLLGFLADRSSRPIPVIVGPLLAALGSSMLPLAPSYGAALLLTGLWGLGSATFHPQGHGAVGLVSPSGRLAFNISLFSVAGMLGGTLSPLYALSLKKLVGYRLLPLAALVPVTLLGLLTWRFLARFDDDEKPAGTFRLGDVGRSLSVVFRKIYRVWAISVTRDTAFQATRFFLPLVVTASGGGLGQIGTILFFMMAAGTLSPLIGGHLSDAFGKERVLFVILLATPLCLVPAALLSGLPSYVLFIVGTALINATQPITAAMGQEAAPEARSTASSIVMGLSWGLGGFAMAPLGYLADRAGLTTTLVVIGLLPLLSLPFLRRRTA